jgi:hypothetical protein
MIFVQFPFERVFGDVFTDLIELIAVTNYSIVVTALPEFFTEGA